MPVLELTKPHKLANTKLKPEDFLTKLYAMLFDVVSEDMTGFVEIESVQHMELPIARAGFPDRIRIYDRQDRNAEPIVEAEVAWSEYGFKVIPMLEAGDTLVLDNRT